MINRSHNSCGKVLPTCFWGFILTILLINTGIAQTAEFTADKTSGCFPLTVNFTDASTGSPGTWTWDFGNGNSSGLKNPSAIYTAPGTYTVQLTVSGGSVKTKTGFIIIYDNPHVDFNFDVTSGCAPLSVNFTDKTNAGSGIITDWLWVFGDGATSTTQNPKHIFTSSGNQTISLKAVNQYGCEKTEVKSQAIQVSGPVSDFDANSTSVCQVPATIQFTNKSTGAGSLSYAWNFGDGHTSSSQNPSNKYTKAGTYTVSLQTTDPAGCKNTISHTINAGNEGGLDFSKSASRLCVGQEVFFAAQAVKNFTNLSWDFGNQTSSTSTTPSVIYAKPGIYSVTLTALLENNSCNSIVTQEIEVLDNAIPDFSFTLDCDFKATFTNKSTKATQWLWEFDQFGSSTIKSPEFLFGGPGSYSIKLTAYNELGCGKSLEKSVAVPDLLTAQFLPALEQDCIEPSLSGCAPFTVPFTNTTKSSQSLTTLWTFGDGTTSGNKDQSHTYTNPGTYTATLKVSNALGCTSTLSKKVTVSNITPVAKFSINTTKVCTREDVEFTDLSTNANFWCWDFGDGENGMGKSVTHNYKKSGTYTVKLTAKNGGCSNTFQMVNAIVVGAPDVDFMVSKICSNPYRVNLTNTSSQFNSLEWNFGDGQTSATDVSSHTYATTGNYTITLKATNNTTQCTVKTTTLVTIRDLQADFEIDNNKPCKNAPINFTDKSAAVANWQWNFGNLKTSTLQNPSTFYETPGIYTVTLTAFDADGCVKQKSLPVEVLNLQGDFNLQSTVSTCNDLTVKFNDLSSGTPAIASWYWDFGDGQTSTDRQPSHVYTAPGSYPVELTLTNASGNCTFIVYNAVVFSVPIPDFSTDKPGHCLQDNISITNYSKNASTYRWDFGNGRTTAETSPQIAYDKTGIYNVTLYAKDSYGCEKSITKSSFITITQPEAMFDAIQTSSACPPLTSIFKNKSTGNIQSYVWNFGDGQRSVLSDPSNTYIIPGAFDVSLIVVDNNNCADTTTLQKLIQVGGPYGDFSLDSQQLFCTNDTLTFDGHSQNTTIHQWDFGDGHVETLTTINARHMYETPGSYKVALILIDEKGCKVGAQGDVQITIVEPTVVAFSYPKCLFENDVLTLQTQSSETDLSFLWEIDGVNVSQDSVVTIPVDAPGYRKVTLHTTNMFGCVSDTTQIISVNGYIEEIPNVFTPNDIDNINSHFEILGVENSIWNLVVYNRWGHPVYKKMKYTNDWDGGNLSTGVYYYVLENAQCPNKSYKGLVSILR